MNTLKQIAMQMLYVTNCENRAHDNCSWDFALKQREELNAMAKRVFPNLSGQELSILLDCLDVDRVLYTDGDAGERVEPHITF